MLSALWNAFFFVIALGILIAVHEYGHFITARLCGIKVLRFSFGFGPVLFSHKGKDGCEYVLSAMPLGGYVKMLGENYNDEFKDCKDSFQAQKLYKRALVISAGPIFNIILSVILYVCINMHGVSIIKPVVGDVVPNSAAYQANFMQYDLIKSINGKEVKSWSDVLLDLIPHAGTDDMLEIKVAGNLGEDENRTLKLSTSTLNVSQNESPLLSLGLRPCSGRIDNVLTVVSKDGPAFKAGIRKGDSIVEVNGIKTPTWYRVADEIALSLGGKISLAVMRDGKIYSAEVLPSMHYNERTGKSTPFIGVGVSAKDLDGLREVKQYSPFAALQKGIKDTLKMSSLVAVAAYKLASGSISADNISGPIAIAKGAGESADFGFIFFISFLAAISVNLGILNLLPIPILDGGQLLFLAYEAIMRRAPSVKVQSFLTSIGFALLLALMLFAVFNDIKGL